MARRRRYGSFTPARRAALKKAQLASAKKRSRLGRAKSHVSRNKGKYAALAGVAIAGGVLGSRKMQTVKKKQNAMKHLNGKKVTISISRHRPVANETFEPGPRRVMQKGRISVYSPDRRHVTRIHGVSTSTLTGGKTASMVRRSPVDRDSIPLYKPNGSKSWPHVGAKQAKRQNKKLRSKGLVE